jgi:multidrug efflux pump subunit AcrA (membrane-fusion protein)
MRSGFLKIIPVIFLVTAVIATGLAGCQSSNSGSTSAQSQEAVISRGSLSLEVTSSGNLAFSTYDDLKFEVSGTTNDPITVQDIVINAGDTVKKGDVLVKLDTTALQKLLNTAQQSYQDAQLSFQQSQLSYRQQELTLQGTRIDYQTAVRALSNSQPSSTSSWVYYQDMGTVDQNLSRALVRIEEDLAALSDGGAVSAAASLNLLKQYLTTAQKAASSTIYVPVTTGQRASDAVNTMQTLIDNAEKARQALARGEMTLQNLKIALDRAQISLDRAKNNLDDARDQLSKANIVAPYDGFITSIPVASGANVQRGMIACSIADPNKFQATILVSEKDIFKVAIGSTSYVGVDAVTGLRLPAKVTEMSPTATIQSGVVNYRVVVEVESPQPLGNQRPDAAGTATDNATTQGAGNRTIVPGGADAAAIARALQQRAQSGQAAAGGQLSASDAAAIARALQQRAQAGRATDNTTIQNVQLRQGLTVSVSVVIQQKSNVLLVPNAAITRVNGQNMVKVSGPAGVLVERPIEIGIADWQFTEVISGLNEGDKVSVPPGTRTTSSNQRFPTGPMVVQAPRTTGR